MGDGRRRAWRVGLWAALGAAVVIPRVGYVTDAPPRILSEVERTAACLVDRGFLGDPYPGYGMPSAHAAPAYPLVLAGVYAVFGRDETGRAAEAALTILVIGAGTALLPAVGRSVVGSETVGWVAAGLMAVVPFEPWLTRGMWEAPWAFLAAGVVVLQLRAVRNAGWSRGSAARFGVVTGGCMLVNPSFGLVAGLFAALELAVGADRRRVAVGSLVAAAAAGVVLAPWAVRNYVVLGGVCLVRSNFGLELAVGNNDTSDGTTLWAFDRGNPRSQDHPYWNPAEAERVRQMGELEYMAARRREAVEWMTAHPAETVGLTVRRAVSYWLPPPDLWNPRDEPQEVRRVRAAGQWAASILAGVGLYRLRLRDAGAARAAVAVLLGLSAAHYFAIVEPRYALPVRGLVLVLAVDAVRIARRPAATGGEAG